MWLNKCYIKELLRSHEQNTSSSFGLLLKCWKYRVLQWKKNCLLHHLSSVSNSISNKTSILKLIPYINFILCDCYCFSVAENQGIKNFHSHHCLLTNNIKTDILDNNLLIPVTQGSVLPSQYQLKGPFLTWNTSNIMIKCK